MKILEHNQIDLKKWDETILASDQPLVFAQTFYLNATSPGWAALVSDDHKTIMPLTVKRKLGINYLIQPPFTPQLGIFGKYDEKTANEFLNFIKSKFKFISIELNSGNASLGITGKNKRTFVIDYTKTYSYNSNTKRNIAKAIKANLICEEVKKQEMLSLTKKYLHPFLKKQLLIKPVQIKMFDQLLSNAGKENCLKTFIVKDQKQSISAMAHFISNGRHSVYLKGKSFDKNLNSGSMHFLMDNAIKYFENKKVATFDFGGGQTDSLAQFFSGFGAHPLEYKIYTSNNLPKAIKWLKK